MKQRTYIAIDLKSFYASVECRERNLDPLDTNLVVADESRTDKTICLAVTPSLKLSLIHILPSDRAGGTANTENGKSLSPVTALLLCWQRSTAARRSPFR